MVTMAQRIEELRTKKGISRPALAAALGLPRLSVEKFETGRQTPTQEQQQKLASRLRRVPRLSPGRDGRPHQHGQLAQRRRACRRSPWSACPRRSGRATAAVVAQSGDNGKSDGGAVFGALLKSDSFKALVRETVLEVLKSPEGLALLAKAVKK